MSDHDDDFDDAETELADEPEQPALGVPTGAIEIEDDYLGNQELPRPREPRKQQPPPPTPHRLSKAERTLRVAAVAQMRVQGFKRADVHAYVNDKLLEKWNFMSERAIDRLIESADKLIRDESVRDIQMERGKAINRYDDLYRKCNANKLYGTALRVQKAINRMLGLDAPIALKHGNDPENPMPVPQGGNFIVLVQEVEEA